MHQKEKENKPAWGVWCDWVIVSYEVSDWVVKSKFVLRIENTILAAADESCTRRIFMIAEDQCGS